MFAARALTMLAAATALAMAMLPHPPPLPGDPNDRLVHACTFVVLALLITQGWPHLAVWTILALLAGFGAAIELVQGTPLIRRDASAWDWAADFAGSLAVLVPLWLCRARREPPRRSQ